MNSRLRNFRIVDLKFKMLKEVKSKMLSSNTLSLYKQNSKSTI